jgi:hypothetical protein
MFCNGVECISGILVRIQNCTESKRFHGEKPLLPGNWPITAPHTALVLRLVDGAQIPKGRWVGGDVWFGSMMSVIETYKRKKLHSIFIIKNNQTFFPI